MYKLWPPTDANGAPIVRLEQCTAIGNAQFTTVYQNANTYFIPPIQQ